MKVEMLDLNGNPVSTVGEYSYDGDGRRIKKHVPSTGELTVFVYDAGGKLIGEYSTIAAPQSPKVSYTTADHLGSPRILTDQNGSVISRRDFHPFGEETFTPHRVQGLGYQPDDVRQKFTSYQRDIELELDFALARYYKKVHGRFTSPDEPLVDQFEDKPQSWNLYAYVRNNPINLIDPSGQAAQCPEGGCPKECPDNKECTLDKDGNIIDIKDAENIKVETAVPRYEIDQTLLLMQRSPRRLGNQFQRAMRNLGSWLRSWFRPARSPVQAQPPQPEGVYGPPVLPTPPYLSRKLSQQKQDRHISPNQGNKSYFARREDAEAAFNAIQNGKAIFLGTTRGGDFVYRIPSVTGYNNNPGTGHLNQPTNVFMLKGTVSPSLVPTNPNWIP